MTAFLSWMAVDTTTVRLGLLILVPLFSFLGSMLGLVKLLPEARSITTKSQLEIITQQAAWIGALQQRCSVLESRLAELEDDPRPHVA